MLLLQSPYTSAYYNLATEEYLFSETQDDILFIYRNEPSVIIGSNQVLYNEVNIDFCKANQINIVRRISGGGAVYHDPGNVNYSFISSKQEDRPVLGSHFLRPVVEALHQIGIQATIGQRKDLWLPDGFKISGTASHISRGRELHHGTLLFDTDTDKLRNALTPHPVKAVGAVRGTPSVPSPVKNIRNYLKEINNADITVEVFLQKLFTIFETMYDSNFVPAPTSSQIDALISGRYMQDAWNLKK
jgi:lipoate-protein ligase A